MAKKNAGAQNEVIEVVVVPVDEVQAEVETTVAEVTAAPVPVLLSSGKWAYGPTTTITCEDCGAERIIKIQDAFQVTRCIHCQKKAQNAKRNAKMKAKGKEARNAARLEEAYKLVAEAEAAKKAAEQQ